MRKAIYILFFLFSLPSISQEVVEIRQFNLFADNTSGVKGSFKICRQAYASTSLTVNYEVTGNGRTYTNLSSSGTLTIPAYNLCVELEFSATSNPTTTQDLTIAISTGNGYTIDSANGFDEVDFKITHRTPLPAFKGAEGAGKYVGSEVNGGTWRGKGVYFVTNTNDTGSGSFKQAITSARTAGGGYIIIKTGGVVTQTSRISLNNTSNVYIMGLTSPEPFVVSGGNNGSMGINDADNIVIRGVTFMNNPSSSVSGGSVDAISINNSTDIYINHCDIAWGVDELISALTNDWRKESGRITFDNNFMLEADPSHNTATLMGALGSTSSVPNRGRRLALAAGVYSWNKNLTYNVSHRFPNASGYGHFESTNNVIANHKERIMQVSHPQPRVNWSYNYIRYGSMSNPGSAITLTNTYGDGNRFSRAAFTQDDKAMGKMYTTGNYMPDYFTNPSADNWAFNEYFFDLQYLGQPYPKTGNELSVAPDVYGSTTYMTAQNAYTYVTGAGGAGNSRRLQGDGSVVNDRVNYLQTKINQVTSNNMPSTYPTRASWTTPTVPSGTGYTDTDNDGMGDTWETENGLVVGTDDHAGKTVDPDGRRDNIEMFFDEIASSSTNVAVTGVTVSPSSVSVTVNSSETLIRTISPSNATNKNGTWTTSNSSVATVSSSGVVTGVSVGSATITYTTADGSFTDTSSITVTSSPVTLDQNKGVPRFIRFLINN